jgi:ankyrin repeat protein
MADGKEHVWMTEETRIDDGTCRGGKKERIVIRASCPQHQAILEAAASGDLPRLSCCGNAQEDIHRIRTARCVSGCSALHWAAGYNQVGVIRYLTSHPIEMDVNERVARSKKAAGRTPFHYAARNGCVQAAACLLNMGADGQAMAKHGVTPFQLALFQNQRAFARWLVQQSCKTTFSVGDHVGMAAVDIFQTNDFGCNAAHWLAICPAGPRSGPFGVDLIPTAQWLESLQVQENHRRLATTSHPTNGKSSSASINLFTAFQKQGHSAFHKAAWMGHTALVRYLHERFDLWDDTPDRAGNYVSVLAEMAGHGETADYIRCHCSRSAQESCRVLGIALSDKDNPSIVRQAYLQQARATHPDRQNSGVSLASRTSTSSTPTDAFAAVCRAYHHLTVEQGRGQQYNPMHSVRLFLPPLTKGEQITTDSAGACTPGTNDDCFPTRLLAVLNEYGDAGLDVSNLKKKWKQVWHTDFPVDTGGSLTDWLRHGAADLVDLRIDAKGCYRVHAKSRNHRQQDDE